MMLIRKIINWIIEFFKRLFKKKKKKSIKVNNQKDVKDNKNNKVAFVLPDYLFIGSQSKDKLIYSINLMKNALEDATIRIKENEDIELIKIIKDKYNFKINEIIDAKYLQLAIKELEDNKQKEIMKIYDNSLKRNQEFKVHIDKIDQVISEINNNNISLLVKNEIEHEISEIVNDKKLSMNLDEKIDDFNTKVKSIIRNFDKSFLDEVVEEYNKVNYVTISNVIIDRYLEKFSNLKNDFKNHRYNKFYYERELEKLKKDLKEIKNLKNKKDVANHISLLKKELYTKSKDKYDLLYNNEVFTKFDKECDMLLEKINAKVIDIKNDQSNKEELTKEESDKKRRIENIILRFKDMELARKLILLSQEEDNELIKLNDNQFISHMFDKYDKGINDSFNFDRNKQKTELVILYNELNMIVSKTNNSSFIPLDHINFRMNDLVEGVEVRKKELENITKVKYDNDIKVDENSKKLVYKNDKNNNQLDKKN